MTDAAEREIRLSVPEMDCPSCAGTVEGALSSVAGVRSIDTRPASGQVVLSCDPDADTERIVAAVEGAGYEVIDSGESIELGGDGSHSIWTSRRALATWVGAALLLAGLTLRFGLPGRNGAVVDVLGRTFTRSHLLFIVSAGLAGTPVLRSGYRSLRARSLDINLLMSIGILAAVAAHMPFEAATLAVLFSIAELLERFSMDRARSSLRELMELSPDEATVRRDGEELTVPVAEVEPGELVIVRPGERIPVDGDVVAGSSPIDQSPITGESVPVDRSEGDEVFAGTIVEGGYLELEATSAAGETTLDRIVELVEDAEAERTDHERFVDRFAAYYTPVIVVAAVLTVVVPPLALGWPWETAFVRGLTLLVIACPCAFVISTPVSVVSGITSAARNGVLIKGGRYLEAMGSVDVIALDKTGTLTRGNLAVTDVIALNGESEDDVLRCASALERRSEHPIADAIVGRAAERGLDDADRHVTNFEALTGKGVRAELDGTTHYAGKPALFEELGVDLDHVHRRADGAGADSAGADGAGADGAGATAAAADPAACEREDCLDLLAEVVPELEREGKTIVLVGREREGGDGIRLEGVIAVADEVRPGAAAAVERLHERGLRTVMLTGDNEGTARAIAAEVGVDEFRAELLPEEKVDAVRELDREGDVAMVGDGINDAPALAAASVGVAMGSAGTDTALETADVALMGDDVSKLPYLVALSRKATGVIRQNIGSSLAVKGVLAAGAPFGYVPVWVAIVVGDMGMSLTVTGNAMRLASVDDED